MLRIALLMILASFILIAPANAQRKKKKKRNKNSLVRCENLPYKEKSVLAVMDFKNSAGGRSDKLGSGMTDMLSNALVKSGCFRVVERSRMNDITGEQGLGLSGMTNQGTGATVGQLTGAQLLVMGNITEFKEIETAIGGGGLINTGGAAVGLVKAHIGFVIKIVDANSGEILISESVDKKVTKIGGIAGGKLGIPAGVAFFKSKAMQDALEKAIIKAVGMIADLKASLPPPSEQVNPVASIPSSADCNLISGGNAPTVMIVIPESHVTRRVPDPAGETEMIRRFLEYGFKVVDQKQIQAIRNNERINAALKDDHLAASLGAEFGADLIVIGEAFSESAGVRNGLNSCRARVEAKVIQTKTGRIVATNGKHASGADIAELIAGKTALKNAGGQLADYFLAQLCQSELFDSTSGTSSTELSITNINFNELRQLTTFLKGLSEVQDIQKSLAGNTGRVHIVHSNSTDDITELILVDSGLQLDVSAFNANKVDLVVQK